MMAVANLLSMGALFVRPKNEHESKTKRSGLGQQTHGSYCSARRTAGRLLSLETNSWLVHLVYSVCPRSAKYQLSLSAMISQYFIARPHLGQSWYATHGR